MTDNTIPIEDAIRAYKDRPSMERELQEIREWKAHVKSWHEKVIAEKCPSDEIHCGCVPALREENNALRAKCERLEHMLYHCYQAGYSAGMANMSSSNMQNDFEICCKVLNEKGEA